MWDSKWIKICMRGWAKAASHMHVGQRQKRHCTVTINGKLYHWAKFITHMGDGQRQRRHCIMRITEDCTLQQNSSPKFLWLQLVVPRSSTDFLPTPSQPAKGSHMQTHTHTHSPTLSHTTCTHEHLCAPSGVLQINTSPPMWNRRSTQLSQTQSNTGMLATSVRCLTQVRALSTKDASNISLTICTMYLLTSVCLQKFATSETDKVSTRKIPECSELGSVAYKTGYLRPKRPVRHQLFPTKTPTNTPRHSVGFGVQRFVCARIDFKNLCGWIRLWLNRHPNIMYTVLYTIQ